MIIPLKFSTKENPYDITIYHPEGKSWDDVYDIQLTGLHKNEESLQFNLGVHIPVNALWKSKGFIHHGEWFEIAMPQPYIEAKYTLVVRIDNEKITLTTHRVNSDGKNGPIHMFHKVYVVECMLKQR